ncbi:MAG: DUF2007 domain-containing protein [Candidatus Latescibacterota bacterium]
MSNQITIRIFNYRHEAEPLRSFLESSGIKAFVNSDDCGSWDPALSLVQGVRLSVQEHDVLRAEELIAAVERQNT